ncbi:MAG: hypothetical protein M3N24_04365 [Actinomycetota bacterium]|nr:hypothetical protein [Actinomycetota bacterium]
MKRIWITVTSTMLFFLLVTGPAWATHLYPPGRGHGGAGGEGGDRDGDGDGDGDDGFDPGEGGGLGDADGVGDAGAGGAGDGLADTGGTFKVWMLLLMVSLLLVGIRLLMASRRRKAAVAE